MSELLAAALSIFALVLMIFGVGAIAGWSWAAKSLDVTPPRWIAGVLLVAGVSFVTSSLLQGQWLTAASATLLYALLVGGALRVGPFRQPRS